MEDRALIEENRQLHKRIDQLTTAARLVVHELARERLVVSEDPEDGDIISVAKDATDEAAEELSSLLDKAI